MIVVTLIFLAVLSGGLLLGALACAGVNYNRPSFMLGRIVRILAGLGMMALGILGLLGFFFNDWLSFALLLLSVLMFVGGAALIGFSIDSIHQRARQRQLTRDVARQEGLAALKVVAPAEYADATGPANIQQALAEIITFYRALMAQQTALVELERSLHRLGLEQQIRVLQSIPLPTASQPDKLIIAAYIGLGLRVDDLLNSVSGRLRHADREIVWSILLEYEFPEDAQTIFSFVLSVFVQAALMVMDANDIPQAGVGELERSLHRIGSEQQIRVLQSIPSIVQAIEQSAPPRAEPQQAQVVRRHKRWIAALYAVVAAIHHRRAEKDVQD